MALKQSAVTVGTTPIALHTVETDRQSGQTIGVRNTGTAALYVGNATVTTANGWIIDAGDRDAFDLDPDETLYAVSVAAGGAAAGYERVPSDGCKRAG